MGTSNERTLYIGNLSERVTEDILYELFLQAGPLASVRIPTYNGRPRPFGFVEFKHEVSVHYAARLFFNTSLYGRMLKIQNRKPSEETMHIHSNIPVTSRLGPPVMPECKLPKPNREEQLFLKKRNEAHLMPSPARKKPREEYFGKTQIPDSLNYEGLLGNVSFSPHNFEEDDLHSRIKSKKKKKKSHKKDGDHNDEGKYNPYIDRNPSSRPDNDRCSTSRYDSDRYGGYLPRRDFRRNEGRFPSRFGNKITHSFGPENFIKNYPNRNSYRNSTSSRTFSRHLHLDT